MQAQPARKPARWIEKVLRVPLFWKIVLANVVLIGALSGAALLLAPVLYGGGNGGSIAAAWAVGVTAVIGVNTLLVGVALRPIREVEAAARRVEAGELEARVRPSPFADRELARVVHVLNRMLDSLQAARRRQEELSARMLAAEESERKGIAHELFGDAAQLMSAALLHLRLARRSLEIERTDDREHTRAAAAIEAARSDVVGALEGIQRIARVLRPPELDELGPLAALEMQARRLSAGRPVRIEIEGEEVGARLNPGTALALYRILQEGLANAVTHADARTIKVALTLDGDWIVAELRDDGRGFDPEGIASHPERHVGLLRMHERARFAGGSVEIDTRPGAGTRIKAYLPRRGAFIGAAGSPEASPGLTAQASAAPVAGSHPVDLRTGGARSSRLL